MSGEHPRVHAECYVLNKKNYCSIVEPEADMSPGCLQCTDPGLKVLVISYGSSANQCKYNPIESTSEILPPGSLRLSSLTLPDPLSSYYSGVTGLRLSKHGLGQWC